MGPSHWWLRLICVACWCSASAAATRADSPPGSPACTIAIESFAPNNDVRILTDEPTEEGAPTWIPGRRK